MSCSGGGGLFTATEKSTSLVAAVDPHHHLIGVAFFPLFLTASEKLTLGETLAALVITTAGKAKVTANSFSLVFRSTSFPRIILGTNLVVNLRVFPFLRVVGGVEVSDSTGVVTVFDFKGGSSPLYQP